ncbi:MAG: hypothetical protein WCA32_22425 [Chromatiaceae bacterium]
MTGAIPKLQMGCGERLRASLPRLPGIAISATGTSRVVPQRLQPAPVPVRRTR